MPILDQSATKNLAKASNLRKGQSLWKFLHSVRAHGQHDSRHLDVEALAGVGQNRLKPRHPELDTDRTYADVFKVVGTLRRAEAERTLLFFSLF